MRRGRERRIVRVASEGKRCTEGEVRKRSTWDVSGVIRSAWGRDQGEARPRKARHTREGDEKKQTKKQVIHEYPDLY